MKFPKEEGLNVKKDRKPERQPGNTLEKNESFYLDLPLKNYMGTKIPHFPADNTRIQN
jgi:hypothetical protein